MEKIKYKISYEEHAKQEDLQILGDGIIAYAKLKKGQPPIEFFTFFVRDENNVIKGGCNGSLYYGCFYIDQLWLDESLRNKGFGTQLMQRAEQYAREKKCLFATVNTMDWEALGFYQKLGYTIEFKREGYLNDSIFYFLRKNLAE